MLNRAPTVEVRLGSMPKWTKEEVTRAGNIRAPLVKEIYEFFYREGREANLDKPELKAPERE